MDAIPILPGFNSGVWDSWVFLISPLIGIVLGPVGGAISVTCGSIVGHLVYFRDPFELLFMFGASVGAAVAGLVYEQRWREAFAVYTVLLVAYFVTPVTWSLPLWGIWDTLSTYLLLIVIVFYRALRGESPSSLNYRRTVLVLSALFGLEADILTRIFFFIPCQTYWLFYGLTSEQLVPIWMVAGIVTPLKVLMSMIVTVLVGGPLLQALPVRTPRQRLGADFQNIEQ